MTLSTYKDGKKISLNWSAAFLHIEPPRAAFLSACPARHPNCKLGSV